MMQNSTLPAMRFALRVVFAILILTEGTAMAQSSTIRGTATYRERLALKPGSVLEIELLDISRQDVPAQRLAAIRIKVSGQVPIPFTLGYDPAMIEPNHTYAVSAKLILNEKVIFRSDTVHPVLTRGAGDTVDVLMVKASRSDTPRPTDLGAPPTQRSSSGATDLIGPTWVAEDIDGKGVVDNLQSTITFTTDGTLHGSGGCNRFHGSYTVAGDKLDLGQLASTSRACLPAIDEQETRFHQALEKTRGYRLDRGLLHLVDLNGNPTMRLWKQN